MVRCDTEAMQASKPRRVPSLDGLRGISIALVIFGHVQGSQGFPTWSTEKEDLANLGVRVFFVISGYLITMLLDEEQRKTGDISLKNFYLRRVFRIVPASYSYLIAVALAYFLGIVALNRWDLLCAATYTSNYYYGRSWYTGHLWSLSVEEQFYLLWPAVVCFASRQKALLAAMAVIVIAPLCRLLILFFWHSQLPGLGTAFPTIADAIAVGCLLALQRRWLSEQRWYMRMISSGWAHLLVPVALILNYTLSTKLRYGVQESLLNIAVALWMDRCVRFSSDPIGRILNSRPLAAVGVLSYSLYIWQQVFLDRHSTKEWQAWPWNLCFASIAAICSYWLVEKPFLRMKSRFEVAAKKPKLSRTRAELFPQEQNAPQALE
jgi:peptidoglycan/LPS O-acetylase OafA/YrhL